MSGVWDAAGAVVGGPIGLAGAALGAGGSAIGDAASGIGGDLFGNGSKPGIFGTGQQDLSGTKYNINQDAAINPNAAASHAELNARLAGVDARQAPQMSAASIGPMTQGHSAQIGPAAQVGGQNIGNIERFQGARLDPASQMTAANINRSDLEFRGGQQNLISDLTAQSHGEGPSLATGQLQAAQDRNAKQAMGIAASMKGGGGSALAQRNLTNQVQTGNQGAAWDSAQARIQEQIDARNQLNGVLSGARNQDIGVNTSQANLQQDATGKNMDALNSFKSQQANLLQQAGLQNQTQSNQRQLDQANLFQRSNEFNAGALNTNQMAQFQGNNQFGMANMGALNSATMKQADLNQSATQSNMDAQLKSQMMKDQMTQYYVSQGLSLDQADRAAAMQMQGMEANQGYGYAGLDQKAYESAATRQGGATQGFLNGVFGLAGSDENMKTEIEPASKKDLFGGGGIIGAPVGVASNVGGAGFGAVSDTADKLPALSSVLNPGQTAGSGPSNPLGDTAMHGSGMDVMGTIRNMNRDEITGPQNHPGGSPGWSKGGPMGLSDEKEKAVLGGGAQATQNFLRNMGNQGSTNAWSGVSAAPMNNNAYNSSTNSMNNNPYSQMAQIARYGGQAPQVYNGPAASYQGADAFMTPGSGNPQQAQVSGGGMGSDASLFGGGSGSNPNGLSSGGMFPPSKMLNNVQSLKNSMYPNFQPNMTPGQKAANSAGSSYAGSNNYSSIPGTTNMTGFDVGINPGNPFNSHSVGGMAAGAFPSFSDERLKNVEVGGEDQAKDFLDPLGAHKYKYKNPEMPGAGAGTYVSPMAQELEKSELGKDMVIDTPNGKMVDYSKGLGTMLASMAMLNKRLDRVESTKKGR